jgi:Arabinose-binding domain of AraC transcription regulator, N-term
MLRWDVERAPTSVQLLVGLGADYELTAQTCLEHTGLRVEDLRDPVATVGARQELTVIANLLTALGDPPGIGLEAGIRYHLTTYGIWGFAMISSPSWRSAIDIGLRYLDLTFAFTRIVARDRGEEFHLVLDTPDIPVALQRFVVERDSAAIRTIQHELFAAPIPIREMRYAFPPPTRTPSATARSSGSPPRSTPARTPWASTRRSWTCRCPSPTSTRTRSPRSSAANCSPGGRPGPGSPGRSGSTSWRGRAPPRTSTRSPPRCT